MSSIPEAVELFRLHLEGAIGIKATSDPATVVPPCIFLGAPTIANRTQGGCVLEIPTHLVAEGIGDAIANLYLADNVLNFMMAAQLPNANPDYLEVAGQKHPTYRGTSTITVRSA